MISAGSGLVEAPSRGKVTPYQQAKLRRLAYAEKRARGLHARPPTADDGLVLTDRDYEVLRTVGRLGCVTLEQLVRYRFGDSRRAAEQRLILLVQAGLLLVSHEEGWPGAVYWASRTAMSLPGVNDFGLAPMRPSPGPAGEALLHRMAVNDVVFQYEEKGFTVLSEREVRACEQGGNEQAARVMVDYLAAELGTVLDGFTDLNGRRRWFCNVDSYGKLYVPDAVVVTAQGLVAVEVELAVKDRTRFGQIIDGYKRRQAFVRVVYFCTPPVEMALVGGVSATHRGWVDGVLQDRNVLRRGVPWDRVPAHVKDACVVQVVPLEPSDEVVAWRLDMRHFHGLRWLTRKEWQRLRAPYRNDAGAVLSNGRRMAFTQWLVHRWPALKQARAEAGLDPYTNEAHPQSGFAAGAPDLPPHVEKPVQISAGLDPAGASGAVMLGTSVDGDEWVDPDTGEMVDAPSAGDGQGPVQEAAGATGGPGGDGADGAVQMPVDASPDGFSDDEDDADEDGSDGGVLVSVDPRGMRDWSSLAGDEWSGFGSDRPWRAWSGDRGTGFGQIGDGDPKPWDAADCCYVYNDGSRWFPTMDWYERAVELGVAPEGMDRVGREVADA